METDIPALLNSSTSINSIDASMSISFSREDADFEAEDPDDPDYLTESELIEIEQSLKDYAEGRFKRGTINDLLKDLDD